MWLPVAVRTVHLVTTYFHDRDGLGLHQRRKVFELRNQYVLTDGTGAEAGKVEQAKQSPLAFLSRLFTNLDVALPTTLAVLDPAGRTVLTLHKPWFTWRVAVTDEAGRVVGTITRKVRIGKPHYAIVDAGGAPVATVVGEDWRSRNFRIQDGLGNELARVTKQWRGLFTEVITDADSYAVTFAPSASDDVRALALAAALTIDLVQKQKDTSGGIEGLLSS
jgi:uncharacterized protein YxjI